MLTDRSDVLTDLNFLSRLLSAFPLLHEPTVEPTPVVAIQYSATFKYVMGLYNNLSEMSRNQQLPADVSPSWLVVLAYAIGSCAPHYSAWQQRREVVMDADRFLACAVEKANFFMTPAAAEEDAVDVSVEADVEVVGKPKTNWRLHKVSKQLAGQTAAANAEGVVDEPQQVTLLAASSLSSFDRQRLGLLLPCAASDYVGASSSSSASTTEYSAWHAARWELRQSAAIAKKSHKNFQIWHHRKELIAFAQRAAEQQFTSAEDVLFKGTPSAIPFGDIDDRPLCDAVLLQQDSKNYHVWQHRAWFVSAFDFVHRVDVADLVAHLWEGGEANNNGRLAFEGPFVDSGVFMAGRVVPLYHATLDNCKRMPRGMTFPNSPLQKEIDYSSILITEDVFNNSAWSYRMHLIEQYVMPAFEAAMASSCATAATDTTGKAGTEADVMGSPHARFVALILEELSYAVTQAGKEVCNECPFVYAKGICEIYSRVAASHQATFGKIFADMLHADGDAEPFVATLMHRSLSHALTVDLMPIVRQVRVEMKDGATPYGKRTTFIKLNTHQCEAGLHHLGAAIASAMLEHLVAKGEVVAAPIAGEGDSSTVMDGPWLLALAGIEKDALLADAAFFTRDQSADLYIKGSAAASPSSVGRFIRVAGSPSVHAVAAAMVSHERLCLALAKRLFIIDGIRSKYWRYEIKRIAYRE